MKKLLAFLLTLTLVFALVGCSDTDTTSTPNVSTDSEAYTAVDMSVAYMTGPTGIGMAKLNADSDAKLTANNYTFTVATAAPDITGKFLKGEINIASVPTNVAANLYNKSNGKVRMLAVNTNGVLSILEKGNTIKSVADLKGKTIYSTGKGQNPEYILNYILNKNGINPATDVTINFVSSDDLKAKLISGEAEIAMAPEPLATAVMVQNKQLNRALSINDEWSKVSDTELMMGCVIALDSYVEANPKAVEKFLEEYEASIKFATTNIDETATYCEKYGIAPKAAIAKKSIPICNLCYVTGTDMKTNVNGYYSVLFDADPTSIGGKLPADDLYYKAD
ncbi:MAG: ABC transporter substrate-binding protein [Clostridia bacterium]|nr:ABC transporter substrate-binding protein [Clostridia bacterium]